MYQRTSYGLLQWAQDTWANRKDGGRLIFSNLRQVHVVIGEKKKVEFEGLFYHQTEQFIPTERAVTEKRVTAGELDTRYCFLLIGKILDRGIYPRSVFQWQHGLPMDDRVYRTLNEWYVTHYHADMNKLTKEIRELHSPGYETFGIGEWRQMTYGYYKDWTIDTGEPKPYRRFKMDVTFLDNPLEGAKLS